MDALHRDGLPLGVVSSKQGNLVREEAEHLGWSGYFGRIVGADDGPVDKPAPEAVTLALDGTEITPGPDVWYVGDTGIDVTCARNSGCTAVIVSADPPRDGDCPRVPDHQSPITRGCMTSCGRTESPYSQQWHACMSMPGARPLGGGGRQG